MDTDVKGEIIVEISNMSRLLGEIRSEEEAVKSARDSFLKLSMLVGRALDISFD